MGASIDMRQMLQDFPNSLKGDVAMMVHTAFIKAFKQHILPMEEEVNSNFLRALSIQLRNVVILKGDYVFFKGEVNKETYFMSKGYIGLAFDVDNSRSRPDHYGRSRGFTADGKALKSMKSGKWGKVAGFVKTVGRFRGGSTVKKEDDGEKEQDVKVSILTDGDTFGNLEPWAKVVKKCSYDALAITKCELFSLPYLELCELAKDYKPEMILMCDYAKEHLQLKRESPKSYFDVDPHEVHENLQMRYAKKKKEVDELDRIELELDPHFEGGIEEVEVQMKDVETRVLDRLDLLEKRLVDAVKNNKNNNKNTKNKNKSK